MDEPFVGPEQRDARIAELEALIEDQRRKICTLEGETIPHLEAEVCELRSIVDAQEEALNDQREIISNQSSLLDELNMHLQDSSSGLHAGVEQEGEVIDSLDDGRSLPPGANTKHGVRAYPLPGPHRRTPPAQASDRRRRELPPNGRGSAYGVATGSNSARTSQLHREQLLAQRKLNRSAAMSAPSDHIRAPRPNSANRKWAASS
eukprot:TRINITY_DN74811_c0_g1_i1.p1 TRINITY_DN74811_c0_g1~~TRINITY_DN74811_c0_g1_i1.p1  ORF type:complete len:205 (+),score=27.31 TRINITY_DN74811_c0_g1_i1:36-650(+)